MRWTEAFVVTGPRAGAVTRAPLLPGEVTIAVEACGLCHRDTGIWRGEIPREFPDVLGHEIVGRVVEPAEGVPWPVGTRVAGMGVRGLARHCRVPAWQVAPVPGRGPQLVLVEPLACAVNARGQDPAAPGSPAVVLGLGLLGLLIGALLAAEGRPVLGCDPSPARRELAASLGIVPAEPAAPELAAAIGAAGSAHECTGDEEVLWRLSSALPPGAALLLVAHHRRGSRPAADLLDLWHRRGIAVRNVVPRTATDMAACVRAAAGSPVDLTRFGLRTGSLADTGRLLDAWPGDDVLRHVVVLPD